MFDVRARRAGASKIGSAAEIGDGGLSSQSELRAPLSWPMSGWFIFGPARARLWARFRFSASDVVHGADARRMGAIHRIAPGRRRSAPQPQPEPEGRIDRPAPSSERPFWGRIPANRMSGRPWTAPIVDILSRATRPETPSTRRPGRAPDPWPCRSGATVGGATRRCGAQDRESGTRGERSGADFCPISAAPQVRVEFGRDRPNFVELGPHIGTTSTNIGRPASASDMARVPAVVLGPRPLGCRVLGQQTRSWPPWAAAGALPGRRNSSLPGAPRKAGPAAAATAAAACLGRAAAWRRLRRRQSSRRRGASYASSDDYDAKQTQ